jgi:Na+-driven multidrug efflux pump
MNTFSIIILFISLIVSAIVITAYYYSVFKQDKIKRYSYSTFILFILHLIGLYVFITIFLYFFIKLVLGSPHIYGRGRATYNPARSGSFSDLFFNQNFKNLFRRNNRMPIKVDSIRPNYIVGDPNRGIPYSSW